MMTSESYACVVYVWILREHTVLGIERGLDHTGSVETVWHFLCKSHEPVHRTLTRIDDM